MTDLAKLKALAEAATPGPWFEDSGCVRLETDSDDDANLVADVYITDNNAAYIAAANPTTILALLSHITRVEAELADTKTEAHEILVAKTKVNNEVIAKLEAERDAAFNEGISAAREHALTICPDNKELHFAIDQLTRPTPHSPMRG